MVRMARRFVGGQPPLFSKRDAHGRPNAHYWTRSPWYWWYQALRRNEGYIATCESPNEGPLYALYKDFGDVRSGDFKSWWTGESRGARLFAEPEMPKVQVVDHPAECGRRVNVLLVEIPLSLPKRFITKRLTAILRKHHKGRRGVRTFVTSSAKYPLKRRYDAISLEKAIAAYDARKAHPDAPLWQIAQIAELTTKARFVHGADDPSRVDKQRVLTNLALRHVKKATSLISNAGQGRFPISS